MTLYVDASAFIKLYVEELDSEACEEIMTADPEWITGRHTSVEVRRNLTRLLPDRALQLAREQFGVDWARSHIVELDRRTCDQAAEVAEITGARTLDALHLGAARRAGGGALPILTYDVRQAAAARSLGWTVLGA